MYKYGGLDKCCRRADRESWRHGAPALAGPYPITDPFAGALESYYMYAEVWRSRGLEAR